MRVADAAAQEAQTASDCGRVEALLVGHPSIADCVVVERTTGENRVELVAYVVSTTTLPVEELRRRLQDGRLPLPDQFVPVSAIPLTPDGLVDVPRLLQLPVTDASLLGRWEERTGSIAGVDQVGAVVEGDARAVLPLHLSRLLPDWQRSEPSSDQASTSRDVRAPGQESVATRLAFVDGGRLDLEPGAPVTLAAALERAAATSRHGILYIAPDGSETTQSYAALLENATRILGGLQAVGVRPTDRVVLQLERHQDFIETFWACVLGGFLPVPVAVPATHDRPSPPLQTLANAWPILESAHIVTVRDAVSGVEGAAERLQLKGARVHAVEELRAADSGRRHPSAPDDLAFLMLTSGSTGTPKAVMLTHRSVSSRTAGSTQLNGFSDRDVTLNWMPLDHVAGLVYFHIRDVFLGCRQIHVPTSNVLQDPLKWLDYLDRYRATITFAPNFAFALVNDREREIAARSWDLSCVRSVLNGAEAIVSKTARRFLSLLQPHGLGPSCMHPAWGMSETSSGVIYGDRFTLARTSDEDSFVEVGRPIPSLSIRIVDNDDRVLGEGAVGRLQVSGAVVTPGYFGSPALTREAFTGDGWFKTGDLGTIRDGRLTITGREKDVVIINSVNYYCHEIESVVDALEGVETSLTAAVPVRPSGANTDRLAIFFHARESHALPELLASIRGEVTAKIGIAPDYLLPVEAAAIPKTSLGKIQRSELGQRFALGEFDAVIEQVDRITANANTIPDWFFRKVWRRKAGARDQLAIENGDAVLLFANRTPLDSELRARLEARGARVISVYAAEAFAPVGDDQYAIDPREEGDYLQLVKSLAGSALSPSRVVHLWGVGDDNGAVTGDAIEAAQVTGALSVLAIAKALSVGHADENNTSLVVVASHSQRIDADDRVAYEKAPALGIVKSLAQELPWLRGRHVDVDPTDPASDAAAIVDELCIRQDDREVAYRGGHRFVACLEKVAFRDEGQRDPVFTRGGTYLVTGGAGGIGSLITTLLVERFDANLLVVGRSELEPARAGALRRLGTREGQVVYAAADVCDESRLTDVVGDYTRRTGRRLDGAIHLAGAYDERLAVDETADHFLALLRPKARGTDVLHRLLVANGGGVLIASSSIAGFFGGASLSTYAAANCFQQAFADCFHDRTTVAHYCFSWSNWSDVGQSRGYQLKESPRARGYQSMPPEQALQSLLIGLAFREPALVVGLDGTNRNIRRHLVDDSDPLEQPVVYYEASSGAGVEAGLRTLEIADRFGSRSHADFIRLAEIPLAPDGGVDREALSRIARARREQASFVPPRTPTERRLAEIWKQLLAVPAVGAGDNFFDLGGDSLLAARLVASVRDAFGADLSLRTIFDAATLSDLAAVVDVPRDATANPCALEPDVVAAPAELRSLSPGQRALWILHQIAPDSSAYNIAITARVVSAVNVAALQQAFQGLVDRHEALRTAFPGVQGHPTAHVHAAMTVPFEVVDASAWSAETLDDRIVSEIKRPFDLAKGPLVRIRLFSQNGSGSFLTVTVHHIVMDGWSMWICLSELGELYRAACGGDPVRLAAPVNGDAIARRQEQMATSAEGARHLEYWKARLGADVPVLNLPTDRPRPAMPTYRGASETFRIAEDTAEGLKRAARDCRATPQMGLLALFAVLLHRYTGQEQLMVGYLTAGRTRPELEPIVGYLANPVPLKLTVPAAATYSEALKETRDTLLEALEHEDYPFSLVVDGVQVGRDASRSPIFQLLFVYEKPQLLETENAASFVAAAPGARMRLGDLELESLGHPPQQEGQFDLTLMAVEVDGEIRFTLDYNTDLFDRSTIRRMGQHLCTLAESAVAEPDRRAATLPMPTEDERRQLRAWNSARGDYGRGSVHEMIEAQVARHANEPAVVSGGSRLTYGELNAKANRLARYLQQSGVATGTPVGLLFERSSLDLIVAMVAVLKAGGAFLPLDPTHPPDRLSFMCRDSSAPVLVTHRPLAEFIPSFAGRVVAIDRDQRVVDDLNATNPSAAAGPDDLAYIIYTSGSTGRPKGVLLEHRGLWNVAQEQQRLFRPGPGTRVLQFASLSFDACVFEMAMALCSGAALHLAPREALLPGLPLLETLKREAITNLTIPPSALSNLPFDPLPALDTLMVAGEACPPELIARWAPGRRFFNLYGPTEATIWATFAECTDGTRLPPIGMPIANTQAYVLDANLQELPVGVPGELYLGGSGLARGYINQPDLARERFVENQFEGDSRERLYRTGDVVRRAEDGQLYYLGRADSQIKLRGFRIELGEIEGALGRHPDVKQAVVVLRDEDNGNRRLVGYVVPRRPVATSTLKRFLQSHLPDYMVPSAYVVMDELPSNTSGKVDRARLPMPDPARQVAEAYAPPTGEVQQRIAEVWRQILRVDRVGADDNFFDLGGNSLLVAQVHARLTDLDGDGLSIVDMFQFPTVRELAARLDRNAGSELVDPSVVAGAEALLAGRARLRDQARRRARRPAGPPDGNG